MEREDVLLTYDHTPGVLLDWSRRSAQRARASTGGIHGQVLAKRLDGIVEAGDATFLQSSHGFPQIEDFRFSFPTSVTFEVEILLQL